MPAQDDEYELMPRTELEYLRKEVEKLKRNPLGDTQASISLLESINRLNASIVQLNGILASANDDMVKMYNDATLQSQIAKIAEQQEKLAKGIVAVADLVKKVESERSTPLPSLDSIIPASSSAASTSIPQMSAGQMNAGPLPQMPEGFQQRNPFDMGARQQPAPIMSEPLPHPDATFAQVPPALQLPPMPGPMQPAQQRSGPNPFIPDADIPPPPPRRR